MRRKTTVWFFFVVIFVLCLSACANVKSSPRAWIDFPLEDAALPVGKPVAVLSHVYARRGISEVVLSVNGKVVRRDPPNDPGVTLNEMRQEWLPQAEGLFTLQVQTFDSKGEPGLPDSVSVRVGGATPTPPPMPDLEITGVEAVVAGFKDDTPFCNTRVTYRNAGTVPVPANFNVQFSYNGVPRLTTTVAGGLPPGGDSELIFDYQFEGTPYIGLNLDIDDVIAESNELNNAFAEIRSCSSDVTPGTPTNTPSPTPTTVTVTPTFTPTPTEEASCPPYAQANLDLKCRKGPSKDYDVLGYLLNGQSAPVVGRNEDSSWWVVETDNVTCWVGGGNVVLNTSECSVPVVTPPELPQEEVPAEEPPQEGDTTAPPVPAPAVPANGLEIACKSSQTLVWMPVQDPSGIQGYIVRLQVMIKKGNWQTVAEYGPVQGKQVDAAVDCGGIYRWSVSAVDGAGNASDWSGWSQFSIQMP